MLKENAMYQKQEDNIMETNDVNLTSKDMEVNFSNKQEDEDELEGRSPHEYGILGSDKDIFKPDGGDMVDDPDL